MDKIIYCFLLFALGAALGLSVAHLAGRGDRRGAQERIDEIAGQLGEARSRNQELEIITARQREHLERERDSLAALERELESSLAGVDTIEELLAELDGLLAWLRRELSIRVDPGGLD